ncbi:hypothetical protein G6F35_013517 [Rhizopus arrhizus]|nr:hypothetical protein G6F35_013517 [Rhizopus arrhizus]
MHRRSGRGSARPVCGGRHQYGQQQGVALRAGVERGGLKRFDQCVDAGELLVIGAEGQVPDRAVALWPFKAGGGLGGGRGERAQGGGDHACRHADKAPPAGWGAHRVAGGQPC